MRLMLRSTGGFTGPAGAQTRTVELAQLGPNEAIELQRLVQACDFFLLPATLLKEAPKSWDFKYDLEVSDGEKIHCVSYNLDTAPAPLRTLTEKLNYEVSPD